MPNTQTIAEYKTETLGELLDKLAEIAKDPEVSQVLDASIESQDGNTYAGFRLLSRTLSDGSKVLDFELLEVEE